MTDFTKGYELLINILRKSICTFGKMVVNAGQGFEHLETARLWHKYHWISNIWEYNFQIASVIFFEWFIYIFEFDIISFESNGFCVWYIHTHMHAHTEMHNTFSIARNFTIALHIDYCIIDHRQFLPDHAVQESTSWDRTFVCTT